MILALIRGTISRFISLFMVEFKFTIDDTSDVEVSEPKKKRKRKRIEHVKVESTKEIAARIAEKQGIPYGRAFELAKIQKQKEIADMTKSRAERLIPPDASPEIRAFALSLVKNKTQEKRAS